MSKIELIPTLEEYQLSQLKGMDILLSLHSKGECYEDCFFCCNEEVLWDSSLVMEVDKMLESHLGSKFGDKIKPHSKCVGYPYSLVCEFCRQEAWIIRNKEYLMTNREGETIYES